MSLSNLNQTSNGIVEKAIAPHRPGRIKFQGTYWKAELADLAIGPIEPGTWVEVVDRRGITLLVVPEGYEISEQPMASDRPDSERSVFANWVQQFSAGFALS